MTLESVGDAAVNGTFRSHRAICLIIVFTLMTWAAIVLSDAACARNQAARSNQLTKDEMAQVYAIIGGVLRSSQFLTPETHNKFWSIMSSRHVSDQDLKKLREITAGWNIRYQKYFWQDAYHSLNGGQPFKSKYRADYEKLGLRMKSITPESIKIHNDLMAKIAAHQPIQYNGKTLVVDHETIKKMMKRLDAGERRMSILFSRKLPQVMR